MDDNKGGLLIGIGKNSEREILKDDLAKDVLDVGIQIGLIMTNTRDEILK